MNIRLMKVLNLSAYIVQPHAKKNYVKVVANLNEINMDKKDIVLNNKVWWFYHWGFLVFFF